MLKTLAEMPNEEIPTDNLSPITNIQCASVLGKIEKEAFLKRKAKIKISSMLCREIFNRKQIMDKNMR